MRAARLSGIDERRAQRTGNRLRKICVGKQDCGRFTTQLESRALDCRRSNLTDPAARHGRPSERDHVNIRMAREHLADHRSCSVDEIEYARRQSSFVDDLSEHGSARRRLFRRLQDHRAARCERVRDLRRDLMQRIVPWCDARDDSDWLLDDLRMTNLFNSVALLRQLRGDRERGDGQPHLRAPRKGNRRADLPRNSLSQFFPSRFKAGPDGKQIACPLRRRCLRPAVECVACRGDGMSSVLSRAERHGRDRRAIDRVVHLVCFAVGALIPRAIDIGTVIAMRHRHS